MYFWQLWRARILGTSLFELCVYVFYECIVKSGAGNGCGIKVRSVSIPEVPYN